jgi:broad specificity phosphatase PhoE
MRAVFIRHGHSTANAGVPSDDLALIELTELGRRQAADIAAAWTECPSLIVTSPYVRTRQTAEPTIKRFQGVPVEIWPIQEFTYLEPSRWNGTLKADRLPHIVRYWEQADPGYCDGAGAESFAMLLRRAAVALERLQKLPEGDLVYAFSHGQFIQAVRSLVTESELSDRENMRRFWTNGEPPVIDNGQLVWLEFGAARWFHWKPANSF